MLPTFEMPAIHTTHNWGWLRWKHWVWKNNWKPTKTKFESHDLDMSKTLPCSVSGVRSEFVQKAILCVQNLQSQLLMLSSDISMILRFTYKSWRTSRRTLLHLSLSRAGSASEWSYCFCVMFSNITPVASPPVESNVVGSVAISRLSCSTDAHIAFLIMNTCCHRW